LGEAAQDPRDDPVVFHQFVRKKRADANRFGSAAHSYFGDDAGACYTAAVQDDRRVVVIGSGPAGSTAALFLARAGVDVTVLEAGGARSALGITLRVAGVTLVNVRHPLRERKEAVTMSADRGAILVEDIAAGGLTNHWSCAVPRFSPDDFSDAERAGEAYTWPVTYADLVPYYDQVEPLLHIAGTPADVPQLPAGRVHHVWRLADDWRRVGAAAPGQGRSVVPLPYTYGFDTTLTLSGTVFNSYVRILKPALSTGRVRVRFDARVLRLEYSAAEHRVTGVVYRDQRTGREERVSCRAVVLGAGAVNTARLLLESGSATFPEGLGNTDGVLGHYLHDHPVGKLMVDLGTRMTVHPPTYISRPSLDRSPPLYAAAGVQWSGTAMLGRSVLAGSPGKLPWIGFNVFGTMAPSPENHVRLDRDRRASDGSSGLDLHIRRPPEADRALEQARDDILALLDRAGMAPRARLWKIEDPGSAIHYAGTCRMHAKPSLGMLDGWSRLHAVPNVMVADSAAFTTGPEKNPVLTAMTLAARGADRLARDLRTGAL
jgi:choline dehydrogenase-like flavoprotein